MTLPVSNAVFPPPVLSETLIKHEQWLDLFSGRGCGPVEVGDRYQFSRKVTPQGGLFSSLLNRAHRFETVEEAATVDPSLHVPAARMVALASSQAVFSSLPTVRGQDAATQATLDQLQEGDFWPLIQSAEVDSSTLGGVYLTTRWDTEMSEVISAMAVPAYVAEPMFVNGYLQSVAFVWKLSPKASGELVTWRLVESHEVLPDGRGVVLFGLYSGGFNNFGQRVPLSDHPEAAVYAELMDGELGDGYFTGLIDRLDVVYVRNARAGANVTWRGVAARSLGTSDFDGVESTMAELDWWETERASEARRARTRLHVPEMFAEPSAAGEGLVQDLDRTVYTVLNANPTLMGESAPALITATSTPLRNEQYQIAMDDLWNKISAATRFSLSTLGVDKDASAVQTATGVKALSGMTAKTADLKQAVWKAALRELFQIMLLQQAVVFGDAGLRPELVEVEFPAVDSVDMTELANTVSILVGAGVMSLRTALRQLHPDWDEQQVDDELAELSQTPVADTSSPSHDYSLSDIESNDSVNDEEKVA